MNILFRYANAHGLNIVLPAKKSQLGNLYDWHKKRTDPSELPWHQEYWHNWGYDILALHSRWDPAMIK